jgi:hypothetical protein
MWNKGCFICGSSRVNDAISPDASYRHVVRESFGPESPQNTVQIRNILAMQLEPLANGAVQRLAIEEAMRGGSSGGSGSGSGSCNKNNSRSGGGSGDRNRNSEDSPGGTGDVDERRAVRARKKAVIELHRRRIHIELLQEEVRRERAAVDELIVAIAIA